MQKIYQPHDALFKAAFSQIEVIQDFLKGRLDPKTLAKIDLDSLRIAPTNLVSEKLKQHYNDLIFSANIAGKQGYLWLILEQQTKADPTMPARLMVASALLMHNSVKKQFKESKQSKDKQKAKEAIRLPNVLTLVLYTGKGSYKYPKRLVDAFDDQALLYAWLESPSVIELTEDSYERLQQEGKAELAEWLMKAAACQEDFCKLLATDPRMRQLFTTSPYSKEAGLYMYCHDKHKDEVAKELYKLAPETHTTVMNTLRAIRQEGITIGAMRGRQEGITIGAMRGRQEGITIGAMRGRQEGITIGATQAKKAIKAKLLKKGVDPKIIKLALTEDQ